MEIKNAKEIRGQKNFFGTFPDKRMLDYSGVDGKLVPG